MMKNDVSECEKHVSENVKMDRIFSWLEDEESRFIFQKRRQFNENGNYQYIEEIIDNYVPEMKDCKWNPGIAENFLRGIRKTGKKVIIWGAGYNGRKLSLMYKSGGVKQTFSVMEVKGNRVQK